MNSEPELLAVTIFCANVSRSITFYEALGVQFDDDLHGGVGPVVIGLHPASERWPTTRTAISLTVPDLGLVTAALDALGVPWESVEGLSGKVIRTSDPVGSRVLLAQRV
ncbi:VOC family protein [Mycolicibacterium brumae]|uniref:Glyoxalase/bleomycin resistance/dioxygenase family protein n=1 Tax=Mycolicibacterium brumae TaxID=85968 RepID=A0A2G5P7R1_9MYCO|nr:hypothetical protein [Mycolicibacterium brumae]MCV7194094.1 hypothetical protein [Mycolicibacterium brumae]PIB74409.1 hypothetical protein CQY22_013140 [Mycolicibacterium brumae]RWA22734.1 hypothetical protein MBRU_12350 [Mycolicibacterium brumae DSM 44177]UWW07460.1 hypothetical protein L2Z93_000475 [Mycolicibacterium brumae]